MKINMYGDANVYGIGIGDIPIMPNSYCVKYKVAYDGHVSNYIIGHYQYIDDILNINVHDICEFCNKHNIDFNRFDIDNLKVIVMEEAG